MKNLINISRGDDAMLNFSKDALSEVTESSDGLVIKFKDGSYFHIYDVRMPVHTKVVIKTSINKYLGGSATLKIDLNNYQSPTMLENF